MAESDIALKQKGKLLFDHELVNGLPAKARYHLFQALTFLELAAMSFKLAAEETPNDETI